MYRKSILLVLFALVLCLIGDASAALPAGWQSQDIGTTGGSANESNGTWTIIGDGADIWGTSDAFHYAYVPLIGDGEITARVVDNGTGSNTWAKGGVMIRETLQANSKHAMMIVTDSDGGGIANQARPSTGGSSVSFHGDITASPPHWVRLVREGNMITAYHGDDGVNWELFTDTSPDGAMTNPLNLPMPEQVYIGLCVTSHAAGELRTYIFDNVNVMLPVIATSPTPDNGAIYPQTWASLSWNAGDKAVSHDVYFGENAADVEAGTGDTFRGNYTDTFFFVGFAGSPYPDGLVIGTTYYWRVDEVQADGTKHTGKVWSFTVPPKTAYNPSPGDGAMFVDVGTILEWSAGYGSKLHNVYFGDDFDVINDAAGAPPYPNTTFNPGPLEFDKTYYWRIDEYVDPLNIYKGNVWSFSTTLPGLGAAVMSRWENIQTTDINTLKSSPKYPNNPDVTEMVDSFLWDGADLSYYGARIEGWVYAPATGDYTFWLATDDQGELWLSSDDDSSNAQMIAYVKDSPTATGGWTNLNEWTKYASQMSEPIPLVAGEKYYIMAIWKENEGGDHCHVAWQGPGIPDITTIPGSNLSPFEPMSAFGAKPANHATGVTQTPVLQWKAGLQAASHEVYFGADEAAVASATKASPEYKGGRSLGEESFEPGKLPWESTFYWRIDEVNALNPDSPWIGSVWSFTTADFLIVDDFEDYDSGENQIWYSWIDGLGFGAPGTDTYNPGNGTGSAVGDETTPSYTEETIVHGGRQSMPLTYDNNKQGFAMYSETEKTLTFPRDFTEEGVANLSLWFRGYPASVGSFVEGPTGTYTMTGSGADIWAVGGVEADEFHYAYKMLTGAGSITARVQSVDNTNVWAKAGVMIRESLNPDSAHAMMVVTPGSGVSFQRRPSTGATSVGDTTAGITAPYWVKIERDLAGNFTGSVSANGTTWTMVGTENIQISANAYIGLALTAHDAALTCQAVFTNVTTTGNVTGQWTNQDIGIASNDAEPLYVALSNKTGTPAVVVHDDPAAAQIDTWIEWVIPLQAFADQGIVLTDVDRIAIGLGTKGNMTIPGGSGTLFIDDIRLTKPAPEPEPEPEL
ncbi:MAG: hypothetical protein JXA81_00915 [Sedimentisphaerales bacterium]|nr:hypothetical protein [Sedimentisphaerales bacterium]